jgi:hypothetical protein
MEADAVRIINKNFSFRFVNYKSKDCQPELVSGSHYNKRNTETSSARINSK